MAVQKRKYDESFKQEALRLLAISGKSVRQIEDDLGITRGLLNKWKLRYQLHPTTVNNTTWKLKIGACVKNWSGLKPSGIS